MKKIKSKKKLILLISLSIVIIIATTTTIVLLNKEDKKVKEKTPSTEITELKQTTILETANAANAAKVIKENIVKITNNVEKSTITGTGFFHESGYLVTNSHIVDIKGTIKVTYPDGKETTATLVSNDITSDIALLSVDNSSSLALTFGNTLSLNITDELYAVGYSLNLEGESSVTKGILSARRSAGGIEYLQTDMSLTTGNSGGPLINDKAEVFGMITYGTENASLGMAISSESLNSIITKLIETKKVSYIDKERPSNALNTVLIEVGHKHDHEDIYHEKDILDKINGIEKTKEEQKEEAKEDEKEPVKVLSNDSKAKKIVIDGKEYPLSAFDNNSVKIFVRRNDLAKSKIEVVTSHPNATYYVDGDRDLKAGESQKILINVVAEDKKSITQYSVWKITTNGYYDDLSKIEFSAGVGKSEKGNYNAIKYYLAAKDRDGIETETNQDNYIDIFTKLNLKAYSVVNGEKRFIKDINITVPVYSFDYEIMKTSDFRNLLTDTDYYENVSNEIVADILLEGTVETYKQGTFNISTTFVINK